MTYFYSADCLIVNLNGVAIYNSRLPGDIVEKECKLEVGVTMVTMLLSHSHLGMIFRRLISLYMKVKADVLCTD